VRVDQQPCADKIQLALVTYLHEVSHSKRELPYNHHPYFFGRSIFPRRQLATDVLTVVVRLQERDRDYLSLVVHD